MKNFLLLSILLLTACGTQGTINADLLNQPVPSDKARVIISRTDVLRYGGIGADVSLNGDKIGSLARGASAVKDVAIGNNLLSVTCLGDPGTYTARFDAQKGKTYKFEVAPNEGKSIWTAGLFGVAGDAVAAHNDTNTGYFQIVPIK